MGGMPVQGKGAKVHGAGGEGGGVLICILSRCNILMHPNFLAWTRGKKQMGIVFVYAPGVAQYFISFSISM